MRFRLFHPFVCAAIMMAASARGAAVVDFSRDVRPILSNRCFKCHGPDEGSRKGKLRLDEYAAATGAGKSGEIAIVPGKPVQSEFIKRLFSHDPDEIMPPAEAKMEMSDGEREILKRWVAQGAAYERHWSFVAPVKVALPAATDANPIDRLVGKKLAAEHLKPSPEAGRYQLIRRVSLDLTGLPPDEKEVENFVNDRSPDAYEKVVDRLLASPHYGERWARRWMDLARYADTNGYEKDRERSIWPWRDWVIRALNADMPFDQFTIRQLAGDLLPEPTVDDRVATGFHRNSMLNEEGGIDPLEFRYHAMTDRVATTGTTWLGLTVGCAQCHTHKYDPMLHREYFSMMAFLNNTEELSLDLPDDQLPVKQAERERRAAALMTKLASKWPVEDGDSKWLPTSLVKAEAESGEVPKILADQSALFASQGPDKETHVIHFDTKGPSVDRVKLEALVAPEIASGGPGRTGHGNFVLSEIELFTRDDNTADAAWVPVKLSSAVSEIEQDGYPVAAAIDGKPETGWAVIKKGTETKSDKRAVIRFERPLATTGIRHFKARLVQNYGDFHTIGRIRLTTGAPLESKLIATPEQASLTAFDAWLDAVRKQTVPWTILRPDAMESSEPILDLEADSSVFVSGDTTKDDRFTLTFKNPPAGIAAIRLDALTDKRLPNYGPGKTYYEGTPGDFLLYRFSVKADGKEVQLASANSAMGDSAKAAIDEDDLTGWKPGRIGEADQAVFELAEPLASAKELVIEMRMGRHYVATMGKFRLSATAISGKAKARVLPADLEETLASGSDEKIAEQRERLYRHFLLNAPELAEASKAIRDLLKPITPVRSLVMTERAPQHPRRTHRHNRGEFLQPAEIVEPDVPPFLPPMKAGEPRNRLGFARWLVSRENPLTARVAVNRQWQAFFGIGLTKTLDDFGYQGEEPSNQELLDWLAVDFMESGWSLKKLHRLIVTSATYRQDSRVTPELLERDPQNRLLARGPRVRSDAEMIRDLSLSAAGLLPEKLYGPPVRPPQPASVTEGTYAGMEWKVSEGEDRYRRALYTFAKRSTPYASFQTFDAPTGEACIARREISNTPLQSLVLLNDEVFYQAAQALGKETSAFPGSAAEKITFAFKRCLTRPPTGSEIERLIVFRDRQLDRLKAGELKTAELMPTGSTDDETGWMTVARILLNLDETITKN